MKMIGQTILHYKITDKLGEGGMGIVYSAEDTKLQRKVAIKFLPSRQSPDEESKLRFIKEARSASALNHPNVCIIHSFEEFTNARSGETEHFIVMEFVSGLTLREKNKEGPLKIIDALNYSIQIAEALKEAHSKGIAHLDIKSDNIMINSQNQIKVMDFGLAKLKDSRDEQSAGGTYGTAAYMSPEQALGKPAGFASDIWSFGVVLYEMLTGKLPFIHNYEAAVIYSIINEEPAPPSNFRDDVNPELEKIILTCLEKEEHKRFRNPEEITIALKKIKKEIELSDIKHAINQERTADVKKETEQKQAAIVFMKFAEYPELIERAGHENLVWIIEECSKIINEITQKYSGTLKKIENANIVLYFGLPVAIENSSQKALNAAIEISDSLFQFGKMNSLPADLKLNTGINTGMVIAGSISSGSKMEYTVIGDAIEIASKICESASYGEILVGQGTYRYIKNHYEFEQVQPASLRGKRDPVKVYKLKSVKEKSSLSIDDSGRVIYSEMIGRVRELDQLEFLLHKAINGEGSIVNIIAEAGLGKTRLISEFKKKEILQRVNILEGKALSTGKNISFHPIIDILRQWAKINENDNESQGFSKLENSVKTLFNGEAEEIIPFIAVLMGFRLSGNYEKRIKDISGDSLKKLIQNSIQNLILKGSYGKPIIFIIEDIHWTDLSSLDLLQSLFRLAENNKILFIGTLRPNFQETGDRIISTIREKYARFYTEINLEPLNSENCSLLLSNLLKTNELPARLKHTVSKSTEGNPFFIEEVIRTLIDENIIEIKNGRFNISRAVDEFVIPGTIKDVLLSRIDKLNEPEKNLLKTASVIGRHFLYDILVKVSVAADVIDSRIRYLEKLELIKENSDTREREYLFKHALVQEAVYETLLKKNKQELHLKTAHVIEELYSERLHDFYEMLAHHYGNANDREKAEEYLIKAG
ncbi:MAG: protein kinase domain-containing protein, partial [Ignavibacteria bacterium]